MNKTTPTIDGESDGSLALRASGFVILPQAFPQLQMSRWSACYDKVMTMAGSPNYKSGSTTDRMSDLLGSSPELAEVFLLAPLLNLAESFFSGPFRLSSFLARTLRADSAAQPLHVDLPRHSADGPVLGFILMVDAFQKFNGATRFVPGSHSWPEVPADGMADVRAKHASEVLARGEAGSLIVFDAAIWHGHSANETRQHRRSIQGYFVRRVVASASDFTGCLSGKGKSRFSIKARYLLGLETDHAPSFLENDGRRVE